MARHEFLGDIASWVTGLGADETSTTSAAGKRVLFIPDGTVTFYDAATDGTQITDLLDGLGSPISSVDADDNGELPPIQGPATDPETWIMWADGADGAGPRRKVVATDMGDEINALSETVSDQADQLVAQAVMIGNSLAVVNYDTDASEWPIRPAGDSRRFAWLGPTPPPIGGDYMVDNFDIYLTTTPV